MANEKEKTATTTKVTGAEKVSEEAKEKVPEAVEAKEPQPVFVPKKGQIKAIHWIGGAKEGTTVVERYTGVDLNTKTTNFTSNYQKHQEFEKTFGTGHGPHPEAQKFFELNFLS